LSGTGVMTYGLYIDAFVTVRSSRAISTDILHFPARVLVIQTVARSCSWAATRTRFCASARATCGSRFSRLRLQTHGPGGPRGRNGGQSTPWSRGRVD
jgi:hypothetical protein